MENKWKYTFTLFLIISCVCCDPNPVLRSSMTARGLSVNRENSGQMSVNAEDLMAEPKVEHVTLEQSKNSTTTPPPVSIVQPVVAPTAMTRIYDIMSGIGVLFTMLMYQIATYYWRSWTSNFRFLRNTDGQHQEYDMSLVGTVTDAIKNMSQQFGSLSEGEGKN